MKENLTISLLLEAEVDFSVEDQLWKVKFPLLPGFVQYGSSRDQAIADAEVAAEKFLVTALRIGFPTPIPPQNATNK